MGITHDIVLTASLRRLWMTCCLLKPRAVIHKAGLARLIHCKGKTSWFWTFGLILARTTNFKQFFFLISYINAQNLLVYANFSLTNFWSGPKSAELVLVSLTLSWSSGKLPCLIPVLHESNFLKLLFFFVRKS